MDIQDWVEEYGDTLYRFALSRVYDEVLAEDLVQTTYLAAINGLKNFAGDSSPKTWLFGILKHKIIDHFRKKKSISLEEISNLDHVFHASFDENGRWTKGYLHWNLAPDEILENKELKKVLWLCIQALPDKLKLIFISREVEGDRSDCICEKYDLTLSNFGVIMHRLRHKLRDCFFEKGVSR
ncbi:MAG: sigma-70 family RNA polymerase sigma factor [Prolixibacteraceae bacterium]|nr:sigma-70 family RNA polymerase sigma factor [Prolixibacteraceae bacterium]